MQCIRIRTTLWKRKQIQRILLPMSSSSSSSNVGNSQVPLGTIAATNHTTNDTAPAVTKKKQRWSRSEKRAAALHEAKTRPSTNRLLQWAQQCPLGATILPSSSSSLLPEEEENVVRVVTSTSSSSIHKEECHIHIKPLLILDLNGILCHRIRKSKQVQIVDGSGNDEAIVYRPFDAHVAGTPVVARPHLHAFLQHLLSSNICLALWTSAKRKTVHALLEQLKIPVSQFLFVWGQDQCLTTNNNDNDDKHVDNSPLFQKDLQNVWKQYPLWNRNNTLLMDDSQEKIISSQEEVAMHPMPLNGRLAASSSLHHTDEQLCQEQDMFVRQWVQHWQQHALLQEYSRSDAEKTLAATTTVTTRWQWECLQDYSRPTMRWGGSLISNSSRSVE